ncbi:MAG: twin-arginine translocase subunit TatC [Pseudomonadota bacterium]
MTEQHSNPVQNEMPLIAHLVELRDRLIRVVAIVFVIFFALYPFSNDIYEFLANPLTSRLPEGVNMIAIDSLQLFFAPFKLTFFAAFFIAIPYVLHQAWAFIAPGLYNHERNFALPLLVSSILLFYTGMAFAYFVVFPIVFGFLMSVQIDNVQAAPDIASYLNTSIKLFFAFGIAFEVPIATVLLIWTGITTADSLREKRPYIIVGAFVVGMLLTPPDAISQTLLAVPMWLLFEAGLFFSKFGPKKDEDEENSIDTDENAAKANSKE